jgi:hypothetical protein
MSPLPQTRKNVLIKCINAAHKKYESNAMDWQMVIEIGWRPITRADMERFEQICEDGLLGPSDYGNFEESTIDRSRDGYLCIKDGLVLEGEIQEMEDKENHYGKKPYKARVLALFLAHHQMRAYRWWLSFRTTELERYCEFKVSLERVMFYGHLLISFFLMDNFFFCFGACIRQV